MKPSSVVLLAGAAVLALVLVSSRSTNRRTVIGARHRLGYLVSGLPRDPSRESKLDQLLEGARAQGGTDLSVTERPNGDVLFEFTGPPAVSETAPLESIVIGELRARLVSFEVLDA